jgi:4-methylaminobutanoate oxidase (formaldehyde-forming)
MEYSFGRQNWFANHAAEHRAARAAVALFDQSGFGKLAVEGADALALLERLCTQRVDVPVGRIVYTAMLNERGGYESDLTVVRVATDRFLLITGTTQVVRDVEWIRRHCEFGQSISVQDLTPAYGVIGVMGPRSRELLVRVSDADLSPESWSFGTARSLSVGMATALALRVTYVGELGWELHVPTDQMVTAHEALMSAGGDLGVTLAGHYAINSLRLEKGYRAYGAELSQDETPVEAGLMFAVDRSKAYLGREAVERVRTEGPRKRLAVFTLLDPTPVLWGSEPILRNRRRVGYTTSGSYAHTLGAGIGMGYVRHPEGRVTTEWLEAGNYEILVNGEAVPARMHLRAPYDPERHRVLA